MANILTNLRNTVIAGFVLALVVFAIFVVVGQYSLTATLSGQLFWAFIFRFLHVISAILWIGLLYYFNFVQIPTMPKIPDDQKPAVSKFIAPEALWYFRWSAMATIATGLILAYLNDYIWGAITLGAADNFANPAVTLIGMGMWLGTIMWFNVWFVIWPNQQKALNIDNKFPDLSKDQRGVHGRTAMLFSRTNFMLSVPMLFCMVGAQHLG
ncbi:MAG: urate hydroxylase PuuD [Micropepsaceae bacterium]